MACGAVGVGVVVAVGHGGAEAPDGRVDGGDDANIHQIKLFFCQDDGQQTPDHSIIEVVDQPSLCYSTQLPVFECCFKKNIFQSWYTRDIPLLIQKRINIITEEIDRIVELMNAVLTISKEDSGKSFQVNYLEDYPASPPYNFKGDSKLNLPNGGTSFLVDIPELPHGGGTIYLVTVAMNGSKDFTETKFKITNFQAGIFAVSKSADWKNPDRKSTRLNSSHT